MSTEIQQELVDRILACANGVAGMSLPMPPDGDVLLEAFEFDSLSLFAFILELERATGVQFDEVFLHHEHLHSVRSTAAVIASLREARPATAVPDSGLAQAGGQ